MRGGTKWIIKECHLSERDAERAIENIIKMREGIHIRITYTDVLKITDDQPVYEIYDYHLGKKQES